MEHFAELITAFAQILWPFIAVFLLIFFRQSIKTAIENGAEIAFEFMGNKVRITPTKKIITGDHQNQENKLPEITEKKEIPADYFYINHHSFYREDKQDQLRALTNLKCKLYYIHITTNSYYQGAVDHVEKVEYYLHETYPEPIQVRTNKKDNFLLKELAYGEYVLIAKIYLKNRKIPLILNRYISLSQ
jgi:hypothetical protein